MNVNIILASVVIILLVTIIILIKVIIHKNNKYTQFQNETTQNYIFLVTFAEFIMYTKSHTDNKIVINDMINAIKKRRHTESIDNFSCKKLLDSNA